MTTVADTTRTTATAKNTQSPEQQRAMAQYIHDTGPYDHLIVVHTFPNWQDRVYPELLGDRSVLTGASLQNSWSSAHQQTLKWVRESAKAGRPWVVSNDEQNPADMGVPPDAGYEGHSGEAIQNGKPYTLHDIRQAMLWGTIMAGGGGVEYKSWDYCHRAGRLTRISFPRKSPAASTAAWIRPAWPAESPSTVQTMIPWWSGFSACRRMKCLRFIVRTARSSATAYSRTTSSSTGRPCRSPGW
jgi:hypothetical protein